MKNIFKSWKAYLTEQLLIEGRLDKAITVATNLKKKIPRDIFSQIPGEDINANLTGPVPL